jgi:hypothetical protein
MALTRRSENQAVFLEAKHYCLWRALKTQVPGCEVVEANNPRTGATVKKFGYRYDTVAGIATKLLKYDTERKYSQRYFGFKLHLVDGAETYVIDMPYHSQLLRRFLRVARAVDWSKPLSITVFKGKKNAGEVEPTGVWFQQQGQTVKPYYTREQPHGMPEATHDSIEDQWDFKAQHRWLVERLITETIPDIETAARKVAPPIEPHTEEERGQEPPEDEGPPNTWEADNSDVPF